MSAIMEFLIIYDLVLLCIWLNLEIVKTVKKWK